MPTHDEICGTILSLLSDHHIRLTPGDLVREVLKRLPGVHRRSIREAIKTLVTGKRLSYTHHFSSSHLELNFRRRVRVSERIYLSPGDCQANQKPGEAVVKILDASAFGGGDHPTTRMVLCGLDAVLAKALHSHSKKKMRALDIGTGSGILALAALRLGVETAVGIDIDHLACDAARKNAILNRLAHRFEIYDQLPGRNAVGTFNLILANLRPPTLIQLFSKIRDMSSPGAIWILSGFRVEEQEGLEKSLPHVGEHLIWSADTCNWAAWAIKFPYGSHWTVTGK